MNYNSTRYRKVPLEVSVQIRILHQEREYRTAKLQKKFPAFPNTTDYRHMKKPIGNILADKRKSNRMTDHKKNK